MVARSDMRADRRERGSDLCADRRVGDRVDPAHLPTAPTWLLRSAATTAAELVDDDRTLARRLLDPWLPQFYEDRTPLWNEVMIERT